MKAYVVAARHRWNHRVFDDVLARRPERWLLLTEPEALSEGFLEAHEPRYVFFPHWSWKVPESIVSRYECVCFHESDVPFGRGGSPIQNLIARGLRDTVVSALRMTDELDAGPVYQKRSLSLEGGGEEIFVRAAEIMAEMMVDIAETEPAPKPQEGEVTVFRRRRPAQSRLPEDVSLTALFDHIRMLDAEGYPHAFLDVGPWRLELRRPALRTGEILADVRITRREEGTDE